MTDDKAKETEIMIEDPSSADEEAQNEELNIPESLPLLPVRDIVVFNYMILPLFVGREKSVRAVDAALNGNRYVLICTQKDDKVEDPEADDLYKVGTVGMIMRMLKMPDGRLKVLIQGLSRARIKKYTSGQEYNQAEIELIREKEIKEFGPEGEALLRVGREQTEKVLSLRGIDSSEIMAVLNNVDEHGRLADLIASNLRMKTEKAQTILECEDPVERLKLVND